MSMRRVRVDCPSCGADVVADAMAELGEERLTGRETVCEACGHPFGVYWY